MSKETFEPMAVKILAHIVEKQDEIIMQTIQQIGGDKYVDVTVDRHKVIEALADYVQKCRRYHPPERKQSEWISVDERLPNDQGRFLIADKEGYVMIAFWAKQFGWFSNTDRRRKVTHWMPLPEPPKMDGGAE